MRHGHALAVILLGLLALVIGCNSMQTSSAILRYQQGEFEMADSLCREALKVNPNDGEAYFYMALSQSMLENYKDAYTNFKEAARLKPDRGEMAQQNIDSNFAKVFNDGVEAVGTDSPELAIEFFTTATQANPESPLGYTNLAKAYWSKAERFQEISTEDYLEYAERALENFTIGLEKETDPEKREETARLMALVLGNLYVDDKDGREGYLTRYREFTAELPDLYSPHEEFGSILFDEAENLRKGRRRVDSNLNIYAGEAYGKAADLRQSLDETQPNIPLWAGMAYMHAEMYDDAARYLEMSTQLDPNYDQAWIFLEYSHFSAKNHDEAIKAGLFLSESLESTEPQVFQILANCYRDKAIACDEAGDNACFQENKTLFEDAWIVYATYKGLPDTTPPTLQTTAEKKAEERRASAIFEKDGVSVITARITGNFVKGTVLNKTGEELEFVELTIDLLDSEGEVLGSAFGELEELVPDQETSFQAGFIEKGVEGFEITDLLAE